MVWATESDQNKQRMIKHCHGDVKLYDSVADKNGDDTAKGCDMLVGGFPCQPFSDMGNNLGTLDARGTVVYDIADWIGKKQPRLFILENVQGLVYNHWAVFKEHLGRKVMAKAATVVAMVTGAYGGIPITIITIIIVIFIVVVVIIVIVVVVVVIVVIIVIVVICLIIAMVIVMMAMMLITIIIVVVVIITTAIAMAIIITATGVEEVVGSK